MHIDLTSAMKMSGLILVLMGLWMGVSVSLGRNRGHLSSRIWAFSAILMGLGYALISQRAESSLFISLLLGHTLSLAGLSGFAAAIALLDKYPVPWRLLASILTLFIASMVITEFLFNTNAYRGYPMSVSYMLIEFIAAYVAIKGARRRSININKAIFAGLFFLMGMANLLRLLQDTVLGTVGYSVYPTDNFLLVFLAWVAVSPILFTTGFFLISAERSQERLRDLASKDSLTGLYNRREMEAISNTIFGERNHNTGTCCILVDADHFKKINDTYGHAFGDEVLIGIANCLKRNSRTQDFAGRIGGEEFLVVLPDTGLQTACIVAEKLRLALVATDFRFNNKDCPVTITLGVACALPNDPHAWKMVERADAALYVGKRDGRNVVKTLDDGEIEFTGTFRAEVYG